MLADRGFRSHRAMLVTLCAFVGSGVLGLPLLGVLAVLAPISIAIAWRRGA